MTIPEKIVGGVPAEPEIAHDYSNGYWGHDYAIHRVVDGGKRLCVSGWGRGIEDGHVLFLAMRTNHDGRAKYRVESIRYHLDPPDMWAADLVFVPRKWCGVCGEYADSDGSHACPMAPGTEGAARP